MKKMFNSEASDTLVLSNEELLMSSLDQISLEAELKEIYFIINDSKDTAMILNQALEHASLALESGNANERDLANLHLAINTALNSVGLECIENLSTEDFNNVDEALKVSIEEGKNILTSIINGIAKTFARYNNIILKYIGKFDTLLSSLGTNLVKRKNELETLTKSGKRIEDATIADDTFWGWNGMAMLGAVGMGKMKDPVDGINQMINAYGKPTFVKDMCESIISMIRDDGKLKPIYSGTEAMRAVERNLGKKIKNFFCKSTKDDRMVIGATYNNVFILERCKPLHLTASIFPWNYSIVASSLPPFDAYGTPKTFDTPKYSDLIKLIDAGIKVTQNQKKVVNDIHDMLKIGSETIKKIDDNTGWENGNIYATLPEILLVLSKTYAEIPNMVDGLASIYIKELKKS